MTISPEARQKMIQGATEAHQRRAEEKAARKMSATQLEKVSFWHESIVDWELANPGKTLNECAKYFDVTPSHLSIVRNCDAFREYSAARRREHNERVSERVLNLVTGVAETSLEVLQERIDAERKTIGLSGVLDTAGMALKSLGFGLPRTTAAPSAAPVALNISIGGGELAEARERMRIVSETHTAETEDARGAADVRTNAPASSEVIHAQEPPVDTLLSPAE